eukprot:CAMPEP_0181189232 /NCGR_PEP_ID=MMETSP1096-20121128/11553_1 /TAXON_ID=156174 ORGANISM="Chrysochromulina ericina, Strain CCMP281" /NCGR_SAMPLE_ID=MMETSP1096 /ASSEMBLY_ACC=CAM_ASM_000453 /LENGTH=84 /DNA_ID=CAMNT_0023278373 /DNA_START=123 /DNA_END=374 /DNA_ORIENTATION=+
MACEFLGLDMSPALPNVTRIMYTSQQAGNVDLASPTASPICDHASVQSGRTAERGQDRRSHLTGRMRHGTWILVASSVLLLAFI